MVLNSSGCFWNYLTSWHILMASGRVSKTRIIVFILLLITIQPEHLILQIRPQSIGLFGEDQFKKDLSDGTGIQQI